MVRSTSLAVGQLPVARVDGYHVAFGKLVDGFDTLDRLGSYGILEGCGAQKGRTSKEIRIVDCGEIKE